MKALFALLLVPVAAHAWQFEAGVGVSKSLDSGDGIWMQQGAQQNREHLRASAYMAGVTGDLWEHGALSVSWHADYTYLGRTSASCVCVPDEDYSLQTHRVINANGPTGRFNGFGHTQGISLTLEPGVTWRGLRFTAEGGPWVYWDTWHETLVDNASGGQLNASHRTTPEVGFVAGVGVSSGNLSVKYRYYSVKQAWNPYPGLVTGAHVLMLTYKF
jgi:hypothetical protein